MKEPIFPINAGGEQYLMVLPGWEADYIQGMLAEKAAPYEFAMLQAMASCLCEGDLVLDVGANIGNHTLYLAAVAGLKVVAFEPNPELCVPFRKAITLNGLDDRATLHEVGVGASEGKAHFAEDMLGLEARIRTVRASRHNRSWTPLWPSASVRARVATEPSGFRSI